MKNQTIIDFFQSLETLEHKITIGLLLTHGNVEKTHRLLNAGLDYIRPIINNETAYSEISELISAENIERIKSKNYSDEKQEAFDAIKTINEMMGDDPLRGMV